MQANHRWQADLGKNARVQLMFKNRYSTSWLFPNPIGTSARDPRQREEMKHHYSAEKCEITSAVCCTTGYRLTTKSKPATDDVAAGTGKLQADVAPGSTSTKPYTTPFQPGPTLQPAAWQRHPPPSPMQISKWNSHLVQRLPSFQDLHYKAHCS
jgi:hypothetical protein